MSLLSPKRRLLGNRKRRQRPGSRRLVGAVALVITAACLIALGKLYPKEIADARARLAGPVSSIVSALQIPLKPLRNLRTHYENLVGLEDELKALRAENEELRAWKWRAIDLERRLSDLRALNRVVYEPDLKFVTATIRARSIGRQNRSALIGAGWSSGVRQSIAVINGQGLVGSTYEVGHSTSRIRFLTDPNSHLPVSIGPRLVTAYASGNGSHTLAIKSETGSLDVAIDDEVITAGEDGGLPRGLRVGRVISTGSSMRIEPYVDFNRLEFVSVLLPANSQVPGSTAKRQSTTSKLASRFDSEAQDDGKELPPDKSVRRPHPAQEPGARR